MDEENQTKEMTNVQTFTPIDQALFESRHVFVSGMVNGELSLKITRELLALEKASSDLPITMWINSPGGEVTSGFSIYDMIQFIKPKVITVVSGLAASMGSVIALAAEKENRFCQPNSKFLLHQPLIGGVMNGSASDLDIHAKDIIKLKNKMHQLYADRTGTPIEKYIELMERDKWVDPEEAIKLGLVSGIMSQKKN